MLYRLREATKGLTRTCGTWCVMGLLLQHEWYSYCIFAILHADAWVLQGHMERSVKLWSQRGQLYSLHQKCCRWCSHTFKVWPNVIDDFVWWKIMQADIPTPSPAFRMEATKTLVLSDACTIFNNPTTLILLIRPKIKPMSTRSQ